MLFNGISYFEASFELLLLCYFFAGSFFLSLNFYAFSNYALGHLFLRSSMVVATCVGPGIASGIINPCLLRWHGSGLVGWNGQKWQISAMNARPCFLEKRPHWAIWKYNRAINLFSPVSLLGSWLPTDSTIIWAVALGSSAVPATHESVS